MKKSILILFSCVALIACDKEDHSQNAIPGANGNAVSISEVTISPTGNQLESERTVFTITANVSWKIQDKPAWLNITPTEGKAGTTSVTMYAGVNNDPEPSRECTLTIAANDHSFSETIKVSQERPYLEISRQNIDFDWNQCDTFNTDKEAITIRCNTDWKITPVAVGPGSLSSMLSPVYEDGIIDWLVCSELEGSPETEDHVLYFNPQTYNLDKDTRLLELEISGALDKYKLSFSQKNLLFSIDIIGSTDNSQYEFAACNTEDVTMVVESDCDWNVESKPDWLILDNESGNNRTTVLLNTDGANPDSEIREGELVLTAQSGTDPLPKRIVEVRQKGYMFKVEPESISLSNNDLTKRPVIIKSSGRWEIEQSSVPSWLYLSAFEGSGNEDGEKLSLSSKTQNLDTLIRSANIEYRSAQQGNNMNQSVKIEQEKFVFEANMPKPDIGTFDTDTHELTINSSGKWKIDVSYAGSPKDNWLDTFDTEGDGPKSIDIKAKEGNINDDDLKATLTIRSITHEEAGINNLSRTITVTQKKYAFSVTTKPEGLTTLSYDAVDTKSISIEIVCSADWTIECPDWLTPSMREGSNNKTVTFTAENNIIKNPREGDLSIKIAHLKTERSFTFHVTQAAFEFDEKLVEFPDLEPLDVQPRTIDIICSGSWEIRDKPSWITITPSSGMGDQTITIKPDENVSLERRPSSFYVLSTLNNLRKEITVSQKPFIFDTEKVTLDEFTALNPSTAQVDIGESTATWTVKDIPDWITVSPSTGGPGAQKLTLTLKENTSTDKRSKTIKVVSVKNEKLVKEISVSQAEFKFDTKAVTVPAFDVLDPKQATVKIGECYGGWKVEEVPEWLTVTPLSGTGAGELTLTVSPNLTSEPHNATFYVTSERVESYRKAITVSQPAYDLSATPTAINIPTTGGKEFIHITCTGKWNVTSDDSWIRFTSATSGEGDATVEFEVSSIATTAQRSGTITLSSEDGYSPVVDITVTQGSKASE